MGWMVSIRLWLCIGEGGVKTSWFEKHLEMVQ